jgi:hypothetical protein
VIARRVFEIGHKGGDLILELFLGGVVGFQLLQRRDITGTPGLKSGFDCFRQFAEVSVFPKLVNRYHQGLKKVDFFLHESFVHVVYLDTSGDVHGFYFMGWKKMFFCIHWIPATW